MFDFRIGLNLNDIFKYIKEIALARKTYFKWSAGHIVNYENKFSLNLRQSRLNAFGYNGKHLVFNEMFFFRFKLPLLLFGPLHTGLLRESAKII